MTDPSVNFNIQGNVGQAAAKIENVNSHIGDVNHYAGEFRNADQVFAKLAEAIPEESQAEVEERVFGPLKEELNTLAATPIAEAELPQVKQSFVEKVSAIVTPFAGTPLAGKLATAAIAVGETGLSLIPPPVGWAITLSLAAIRALK